MRVNFLASGNEWHEWSLGCLITREKATEGIRLSLTIQEISSSRTFKMTNSGATYCSKQNFHYFHLAETCVGEKVLMGLKRS